MTRARLSDIAAIHIGSTPSQALISGDEDDGFTVPFIRVEDIPVATTSVPHVSGGRDAILTTPSVTNLRIVPASSILFSIRATIGKIAINDSPVVVNQGVASITPHPGTDVQYLAECLRYSIDALRSQSGGTIFPHLRLSALRDFSIVLPSASGQQDIVCIMQAFDKLKDGMLDGMRTADALLPELYKRCFTTPQRPIPLELRRLGQQIPVKNRMDSSGELKTGSFMRLITPRDFISCGAIRTPFPPNSFDRVDSATSLESGDVLISRGRTSVGKLAIISERELPCTVTDDIIVFRPDTRLVDPWSIVGQYAPFSDGIRDAGAQGSSTQRMRWQDLNEAFVYVHQMHLQQAFSEVASALGQVVAQIDEQLQRLSFGRSQAFSYLSSAVTSR